ncbi:hypothetical protein DWW59_07520 [Firmicutes bacterium AF16-15]|nr:hypothetical protein DWW59_07520 [Firmicutes bacterium AF16-15]
MAVTSGHFIRKGTDQRPAAAAAFAFSLRRFFVDIQGHGRAPGCPFQEGNGKTQHGKENPKFFFPDYRSRSRFLRPTAITAVSLPSGGKGVLKERCTGRDVTPVLCRNLFAPHETRYRPVADKIAAVLHNSFAASIEEITKRLSV